MGLGSDVMGGVEDLVKGAIKFREAIRVCGMAAVEVVVGMNNVGIAFMLCRSSDVMDDGVGHIEIVVVGVKPEERDVATKFQGQSSGEHPGGNFVSVVR